jgi:WD40 repeat protein
MQEIVALETSRDGRWLASGDSDGSVSLWDLAARRDKPVWQTGPGGGQVLSLSFSADSRQLVSSAGYSVRVRDAATGKVILDLGATGRIAHAFFTAPERLIVLSGPSGDRLEQFQVFESPKTNAIVSTTGEHQGNVFALSSDRKLLAQCDHWEIRLRDTATGEERSRWRSPNYVISLAFSPDGQKLAACELRQGTVAVWDIATRHLSGRLTVSSGLVSGAAFSPDGQTLATAGFDQTVRLWDLGERRELQRWRGHRGGVRSVTFTRDGSVVSGGADATVRIWTSAAHPPDPPLTNAAGAFAFGPDGHQLATADLDGGLTIWDLPAFRPTHRWGVRPAKTLLFSPQTNLLLAAGIQDSNQPPLLTRLPLAGGGEPVSLPLRGAPASATDIQLAPNGQVCITGHTNGAIVFWDTASATGLDTLNAFTNAVDQIFVSPNSKYLFAKTWSPMRFATFDLSARQMLTNVLLANRYAVTVAFWPDGRKFAIAGDPSRDIKILDTATLKPLGTLLGHPDRVRCLAFSPDSRTLVSEGRERSFRFWHLATGRQMLGWPQLEWTRQLAFSPDGSWLGASDYAGRLRLWHAPPLAK